MQPTYLRESLTLTTHYVGAVEHRHSNCEILLALEGDAINIVNGKNEKLTSGEVIFLNTNVLHELKNTSKNHRHQDIYISKDELLKICTNLFDEEFYHFLVDSNKEIKINLSRDEFGILATKSHEIELQQDFAVKEDKLEICKNSVAAIIIQLLSSLYSEIHFEKVHKTDKLTTFLDFVRRQEIFTLPIERIVPLSNYSRVHLDRLFKKNYGNSFKDYINELRLSYAKELLSSTNKPISDIAFEVGFQSESYFIQLFKKQNGKTPLQFRKSY